MNVSKLIWVGSCFGGLLSFASSAKVLPVGDQASSLQNSTSQKSNYETQTTTGVKTIQESWESFLTGQRTIRLSQVSQNRLYGASDSGTDVVLEKSESAPPSLTEDQNAPKSFFSVLSTQSDAQVDEDPNQSSTTLPLASVEVVDEAIAPVARLSQQTVAQVQLDSVVAVLPRRPKSGYLPTQSESHRHASNALLPSLRSGMFAQCSQMIWDDSSQTNVVDENTDSSVTTSSVTTLTAVTPNFSPDSVTSDPQDYRVFVNSQLVAEFPSRQQADQFAETTRNWLTGESFDPNAIKPRIVNGKPTIATDSQETVLLTINDDLAQYAQTTPVGVAIAWSNTLRRALGGSDLDLADAQISLQKLEYTGQQMEGTASWYGPYFHGRLTASGVPFDQEAMTAAHPSLPFGTYLKVTNQENGHSVVVEVNDRGPYIGERSLDLSRQAAECLGSEITGVVPYDAKIMHLSTSPDTSPSFMALVSRN